MPLLPGLARLFGVMVAVNIPPTAVILGWRWLARRITLHQQAARPAPASIHHHQWCMPYDDVGRTTSDDGGVW